MSEGAASTEEVAGVGMFVAGFVDEGAAEGALAGMKEAKKSGEFYFDDAAVIRSDRKGKVHIKETGDMSAGKGAGIGALVFGVLSLLGGPAGVALSAAVGAAGGALVVARDSGFDNDSLKELGAALPPGTSAIVATTSKKFVEEVRKQAPEGETLSVAREIAADIRGNLEARQDVLYGLVITEQGVAAKKVISAPDMVAVFGIAADESAVVAGAAVATPEGVAYKVAAATEDEVAAEAGVVTEEGAVVVDAYGTAEGEEEAE
jgi:uncharacterized membrane protein